MDPARGVPGRAVDLSCSGGGATGIEALLQLQGHEIQDAEEESFLLFSQKLPDARNLGFVDAKADTISVALGGDGINGGRELTIAQSPTLLNSALRTGTTGAVLWKVTPLVAAWLCDPANPLFMAGLLGAKSTVLELGCGVSGVLAAALAPLVAKYVCTDQEYALKLLQRNLSENVGSAGNGPASSRQRNSNKKNKKINNPKPSATPTNSASNIQILELDWETSQTSTLPDLLNGSSADAIIACDCIYNSHLIHPFVQTCADICRLRDGSSSHHDPDSSAPTICIIAQQLRSPEIFAEWLEAFLHEFRVWRLPDPSLLPVEDLQSGKGFVVHLGILRR